MRIQHQNIRRPIGNGFGNGFGNGRGNRSVTPYVYAYPVYIGGGYDNSFAPQESYGPEVGPPPQQQPNITVIYPPQQHARPVMIQPGPDGEYNTNVRPPANIYETPRPGDSVSEPEPAESNRYLLAFKDHTIYSAVAYWVDGDTISRARRFVDGGGRPHVGVVFAVRSGWIMTGLACCCGG